MAADIGVYPHKNGGGDSAKTGYADIGVYQAPEAEPPPAATETVTVTLTGLA